MSIEFDPLNGVFHLKTLTSSYLIQIIRDRYVAHLGWFGRIDRWKGSNALAFVDRSFSPNPDPSDRTFSLDTLPQEYPGYGRTDYRSPAFQVRMHDGSSAIDLFYSGHTIFKGKKRLPGLPAVYVENESEADTLELTLKDPVSSLTCVLSYTVWNDRDVITRNASFSNESDKRITLLRAMSASLDFEVSDYRMLQLSGAHCRERHPILRHLVPGSQSIESRRGTSSHQQNPFIALLSPTTDEDHGEVFGFNLVYSGNFLAQVEVDQFSSARVMIGINPFEFEWLLEPGSSFQTPELIMVRSEEGLGGMSRTFHDLYRSRLCRGKFRDSERPVLINSWEGTYFDFNSKKIEAMAQEAASLGIELFVLDDGWFGKRDDDKSSLGDWVPNERKLPDGLKPLAERVRSVGIDFGLWLEPEMISVNSDLYRAHPDWCLHCKGRSRSEGRNQLVLDFSRSDVRDYIVETISSVLRSAPISYVKWDMNRHLTEIGSATASAERQRETAHRYILGVYEVLERITTTFPDILFESCSGGGGRYDPGMLYYMPQTWTSDNTDAVSRVIIQRGTSIPYPAISMGSHVSTVPNHQTGRTVPLAFRGAVAMGGNFGYELDVTQLTPAEKTEIINQVRLYKNIRSLVQFGDLYRLDDLGKDPTWAAWSYVAKDKREAVVTFVMLRTEANAPFKVLKLKGLDPGLEYEFLSDGRLFGGDELMRVGVRLHYPLGEADSVIIRLRATK